MGAAAWAYLQIARPVYQINAAILINDEKKGVADPSIVETFDAYSSKKIVENEIEVIKSKKLMRETVEALGLASPVFEENTFAPISAYSSSPVMVEVKDLDSISEVARADFSYDSVKNRVTYNYREYALGEWFHSEYGQIRFVKNIHLEKIGRGPFYFSLIDPRKITYSLLASLNVQSSNKLSTVISLSIRDIAPRRGENILNTLIESYNRAAVSDNNKLATSTLEFVEDRIRDIEKELDSLELSIQHYKSSRGIVDLSEQGKLFLKNVGENDQRLSELNVQLAVLNKLENYVIKKDNARGSVPSTLGIDDHRLPLLIQKLYESEIQYERLRNTTAENNPLLLSLQNEIQSLRPGILENIRNQRSSLLASRANLTTTNNKYASVLETIPQQERELLEASRQQSIKNNVYTFLLQKREETALSYASTGAYSRLVDEAESSFFPVSPNKPMVYLSALALAFVIGVAWVTLKEVLTSKILFRSEIESYTRIPIAAEISYSGTKEYIVVDNAKNFLTEQFRHLRTAIGLYGDTSKKVIMVTSAISGEGKSFISANLATLMSGSNKKVLLVDIDLRNPRLSTFYKATNISGVAEYLNENISIDEIIKRTILPNLFIVAAGKKRANPTELLLNGNLPKLFEKLREKFDYIIVDTAPIDPVSDAYIISPYCDSTLFVVRHGKTPKTILQLLDSNIKVKALSDVSIVFNGIRSRGFVKSAHGYGYGYGFEYVYSYSQPNPKLENKAIKKS